MTCISCGFCARPALASARPKRPIVVFWRHCVQSTVVQPFYEDVLVQKTTIKSMLLWGGTFRQCSAIPVPLVIYADNCTMLIRAGSANAKLRHELAKQLLHSCWNGTYVLRATDLENGEYCKHELITFLACGKHKSRLVFGKVWMHDQPSALWYVERTRFHKRGTRTKFPKNRIL